jgi:purine-binding chemotaxis protein CheW
MGKRHGASAFPWTERQRSSATALVHASRISFHREFFLMTAAMPQTSDPAPRMQAAVGHEQLVSFCLGAEEYAVTITAVREIILMTGMTRLPSAPDYVKGLINLRNTVIPVVDLRRRFNLEEQAPTADTRIMVVHLRGKTVGLVVDAVREVFRIARDQVAPPPPTATDERSLITGLVRSGDRLVILLDIDRILDEDDA